MPLLCDLCMICNLITPSINYYSGRGQQMLISILCGTYRAKSNSVIVAALAVRSARWWVTRFRRSSRSRWLHSNSLATLKRLAGEARQALACWMMIVHVALSIRSAHTRTRILAFGLNTSFVIGAVRVQHTLWSTFYIRITKVLRQALQNYKK